jgi:hypothetical protein
MITLTCSDLWDEAQRQEGVCWAGHQNSEGAGKRKTMFKRLATALTPHIVLQQTGRANIEFSDSDAAPA